MGAEFSKAVGILEDLIIAAFFLGLLSGVYYIVSTYQRQQDVEQASVLNMKEEREFNKYKDQELASQDVISVILEYRDSMEFWVDELDGDGVSWVLKLGKNFDTPISAYSQENLSNNFIATDKYFSRIVRSSNGEILGIKFYKGKPTDMSPEKFRDDD